LATLVKEPALSCAALLLAFDAAKLSQQGIEVFVPNLLPGLADFRQKPQLSPNPPWLLWTRRAYVHFQINLNRYPSNIQSFSKQKDGSTLLLPSLCN